MHLVLRPRIFFFSSPPSAFVPLISPAKERLHAARHSHNSRGLHKRIQVWLAVGLSRSTDICMMMTLTLQCACMDCKPITTCCNHIGISDDTFLSSFDCPVVQRYFSHHPRGFPSSPFHPLGEKRLRIASLCNLHYVLTLRLVPHVFRFLLSPRNTALES